MPRIQLASLGAGVAQTVSGAVRPNRPGTITHTSDGSGVILYAAETGSTTIGTGSFTTDAFGRVPGWVDTPDFGAEVQIQVPPADPLNVIVGLSGPAGPAGPAGTGANFRGPYNATVTYPIGDAVLASDLNWYVSLVAGNLGNNPVGDGNVHWAPLYGFTDGRYRQQVATPTATDARYGCIADAGKFSSISVTGTTITFGGANLTASQVGKTILIELAGTAGDAFVTTLLSRTNSTTGTLAAAVTTNVSGVHAYVGTDNKVGLKQLALDCIQGSLDGLVKAGTYGRIPPGNYLCTEFWSDPALSTALLTSQRGWHVKGDGTGTMGSDASAVTQIWYAGTGSAINISNATGMYNLDIGGFAIKNLRPIGAGATTWSVYIENVNHSTVEELQVVGQQTASLAHVNQGSGFAWTNMSEGINTIKHVNVRDFAAADSEGITIGEWDTALNTHGDCGDMHIDTCEVQTCTQPFHFRTTGGGLWEGNIVANCKATNAVTGTTNAAFLVDANAQAAFTACHSEGQYNAFKFNNSQGCTVDGGSFTYHIATAGDGSAVFNFVGARGNIVNSSMFGGWTTGVPGAPTGTPGFSFAAKYDSASSANSVRAVILPNFSVIGTAFVSDAGFGNVTKNQAFAINDVASTGTPYLWTPLVERAGFLSATAATTYILGTQGNLSIVAVNGANTAEGVFYFDPALFQPGSRLMLQAKALTNAVAPGAGANFNFAMLAVGSWGGASGAVPTVATTTGAAIAATNILSPAATSQTMQKTNPVALPAAGWYVLTVILQGAQAAGAEEVLQATVLVGQPT